MKTWLPPLVGIALAVALLFIGLKCHQPTPPDDILAVPKTTTTRTLTIPDLDVTCFPTKSITPTPSPAPITTSGTFITKMPPPHDAETWIVVTPEMQALLDRDEIHQFIVRVNKAAEAKPYWHDDFRRAFYDACQEESTKHSLELLKAHGFVP